MKQLLTIIFFVFALSAIAQNNSFVKYFDSAWKPCSKEIASFYTQFEKFDTVYKCTSYYMPSNKLFGKSTFADTTFSKGIGLMIRYYESGSINDSTYFDLKGNVWINKKYFENGQLEATGGFIDDNYSMKDYVGKPYQEFKNLIGTAAEFPLGLKEWERYLTSKLRANLPVRKGAPKGKYSVIISFIINESGNVTEIKAENNPGFGTKEEAIRVISKSAKWKPAILNNKPVRYKHRQSIIFQVSEN